MSIDLYANFRGQVPPEFQAAADDVIAICGEVDGGLAGGVLALTGAIKALWRACRHSGLDMTADLSPAQIQDLAARIRFCEDDDPCYVLSARAFIQTCAKLGLGATFF